MVVWHDAALVPAVDHGQQRQVRVGLALGARDARQRKLLEQVVAQQQVGAAVVTGAAKDVVAGPLDALSELKALALEHQLEQLGDRGRILADLDLGGRVEDGQAGVHVPLVAVDAQRHVDLDVLDAARPALLLPGELVVGSPGRAHAQECGMGHGLGVGRDAVMLLGCQVHELGLEA